MRPIADSAMSEEIGQRASRVGSTSLPRDVRYLPTLRTGRIIRYPLDLPTPFHAQKIGLGLDHYPLPTRPPTTASKWPTHYFSRSESSEVKHREPRPRMNCALVEIIERAVVQGLLKLGISPRAVQSKLATKRQCDWSQAACTDDRRGS
jgi:hypothetical protein